MPTPGTDRWSFRLQPEMKSMIEQIAAEKGGLTWTQILTNAVRLYHRSMFGRRSADLTPPTIRPAGRTKG